MKHFQQKAIFHDFSRPRSLKHALIGQWYNVGGTFPPWRFYDLLFLLLLRIRDGKRPNHCTNTEVLDENQWVTQNTQCWEAAQLPGRWVRASITSKPHRQLQSSFKRRKREMGIKVSLQTCFKVYKYTLIWFTICLT